MKKIIVYTGNNCAYCNMVKKLLKDNGYEFIEKNVNNQQNRRELIDLGYMSIPVIQIGEEFILGFHKEQILQKLKED